MQPFCALICAPDSRSTRTLCGQLAGSRLVDRVIVIQPAEEVSKAAQRVRVLPGEYPPGGPALMHALEQAGPCELLLVITQPRLDISEQELQFLVSRAEEYPDAGMLYSDFFIGDRKRIHPLIACQSGSIRDDFMFGPIQLYRRSCIAQALRTDGALSPGVCGGLYELRLKVSCCGKIEHLNEPVGCVPDDAEARNSHFAYVDPANAQHQRELEAIATAHLERIGALCRMPPRSFHARVQGWPVETSIVIPVRNRSRTIADAIRSALSQKAPYAFNVLVVDNHSTDGTADIISGFARDDKRLVHMVPPSTGLGIGGCWNTAVGSPQCGRFVCQLDSDDLYADSSTLKRMTALLQQGCGMAVGSYRLVNFNCEDIPPGIVDHREWTPENGRNNLLRVQGIGAPRAFATELLRAHPFPDVSYGEDYAVALRLSREYRVGRLFDPVYLCRRWEDNTDSDISAEQANRFAVYKDTLRTREIEQRIRIGHDPDEQRGGTRDET